MIVFVDAFSIRQEDNDLFLFLFGDHHVHVRYKVKKKVTTFLSDGNNDWLTSIGKKQGVFFVFTFKNLLWGSVNNGQPLHGLHNTKSLRTSGLSGAKRKAM